jgi:hypothetical protein
MPAICLIVRKSAKSARCLLTLLLFAACATAQPKPKMPKEIQIGTFQFRGTTDPNCAPFCSTGYVATIDASAVTGDVLSFGDMIWCIGTICQHSGPETTPIEIFAPAGDPGDILPDCAHVACRSIDLQLVSTTGQPFSLVLLDGITFTTYAVNTITMKALPGQHVLQPAPSIFGPFQSVPIMLELDRKAK